MKKILKYTENKNNNFKYSMIKTYNEFIIESRTIKDYKDTELNDVLENIIKEYGGENVYLSFRTGVYVTDFNRINKWTTPTGYYVYPLLSYLEPGKYTFKKTTTKFDEEEFEKYFPYVTSDPKYLDIIVLNDTLENLNILHGDTDLKKLDDFANRIKKSYGEDNKKVIKVCNSWFDRTFKPVYYTDPELTSTVTFEPDDLRLYRTTKTIHHTHKFWYFIHKISELITKSNRQHTFKRICNEIGINGFMDFGDSYINPLESSQGVFFKLKTITKFKYSYKLVKDSRSIENKVSKISKQIKYKIDNNLMTDEIINNYKKFLEKLLISVRDLSNFIIKYPVLIDFLQLKYLNSDEISKILKYRPELIDKLNISILLDEDIDFLIKKNPLLKNKLLKNKKNPVDLIKKFMSNITSNKLLWGPEKNWLRTQYDNIDISILVDFFSIYYQELDYLHGEKMYELFRNYWDNFSTSEISIHSIVEGVIKYQKTGNMFTQNDLNKIKRLHNVRNIHTFFIKNPNELKNYLEYKTVSGYYNPLNTLSFNVLKTNPELHKYFDLKKVDSPNFFYIIIKHPFLLKYFDIEKLNLRKDLIEDLIDYHPQLKDQLKQYI